MEYQEPVADVTRIARSVRWASAAKAIVQVLTFTTTVLVARMLGKEEFGLFALGLLYVALIEVVVDFGLVSAIVQRRAVSDAQLSSCFWLLCATACAFLLVSQWVAPALIGWIFDESRLEPLVQVLSLSFISVPFTVFGSALLTRAVRVDTLSKIELLAGVVRCAVVIGCSLTGHGLMSLVYGFLAERIVLSMLLVGATSWRPTICLDVATAAPLLSFGLQITTARLLWFGYSKLDTLIIGRILGVEILGAYTLAQQLAGSALQLISAVYYRIAFPVLSQFQDSTRLPDVFLNFSVYLAIATLPLFLGLSAVSGDLVEVLLTDRWSDAVVPLQVLAGIAAMQSLSGLMSQATNAAGRPHKDSLVSLVSLLVFGAGFYLGAAWAGLAGVLVAWLVLFPARFIVVLYVTAATIGLRQRRYWQAHFLPIVAAVLMACAVVFFRHFSESWSAHLRLAASVSIGIIVYMILGISLLKDPMSAMIGLVFPKRNRLTS